MGLRKGAGTGWLHRGLLPFWVFVGCAASSHEPGSDDPAGRTQCTALREHTLNLRFGADPSAATQKARANTREQLGEAFFADCAKRYTVAQVRCAITQADTAKTEACLAAR